MTYINRMESMVTPRTGYTFTVDGEVLTRGRSVPADHPVVRARRAAFMLATEGCVPLAAPKPKAKKKAKAEEPSTEEASE